MSARDIVGGLAGAAVGAVKHPVGTAGEAISKAKGAVSAGTAAGTAVAGTVVGKVRGGAGEAKDKAGTKAKEAAKDSAGTAKDTAVKAAAVAKTTTDVAADAARSTAEKTAGTAKQTAKKAGAKAPASKKSGAATPKKGTGKKAAGRKAVKREPQVVLAEPTLPAEPPIDVVGQALAAEKQDSFGAGRSTEPRGASRDEEHGDASLQRAEAAEIAAEIAEASGLDSDIETPVGTTGAEVGNNPSTAEADLQQPGTEPLLDPALTKSLKSEQDTLHKAADTDK